MTISLLPNASVNARSTRGMTPVYRLTLNGEPLDMTVSEAKITQGEYQHDTVTLSGSSATLTTLEKMPGAAVSFYYGLSPRTEIFNGYVTSVADNQNAQGAGALTFTLNILGATKSMQSGLPRFWADRSIPSAVEILANTNLLGFVSHAAPFLWQTLAQTEETDWKRACDFAKRLGWALYNRYGVVMLWNPMQLFTNSGPATSLIASQYQSMATSFEDMERTLVDFTPVEDAVPAYQNMGAKVAYFDRPPSNNVVVFTQPGEYAIYKFLTGLVIRSTTEAEIFASTHDTLSSEWKQQATARVLGNATLFPGMSVDVYTSNPKYFRDRYNGRWLIRGVQHNLNKQSFQSQLLLARPDSSISAYRGTYVNFWNDLGRAKPLLTLDSTATDALGNTTPQWVSSWSDRRQRSVA